MKCDCARLTKPSTFRLVVPLAVVENSTLFEQRCSTPASGRNHHRSKWHRAGKAKAIIATARKIAVLFHNSLRHGMAYLIPVPHNMRSAIAAG